MSKKIMSGELRGTLLGIVSAVIGGICPIYWKQIKVIDSAVILLYRVVLACIFTFIVCLVRYKWSGIIEPLKRKGAVLRFFLTGMVMVVNWGVYVWAVNAGFIVQTSIGYFMAPLLVGLIGMVVYHEAVVRHKIIALLIVLVGTIALIIAYGEFPTIAFAVALSYAVYTSAQKNAHVSGVQAMFYQTLLVSPIFICILLYVELTGQGAFAVASTSELFILSFAGIVTVTPLILLLNGINTASLIVMGLTNYLGDTISMLIGIFVYGETISIPQLGGLSIIWVGIGLYTVGEMERSKHSGKNNGKNVIENDK